MCRGHTGAALPSINPDPDTTYRACRLALEVVPTQSYRHKVPDSGMFVKTWPDNAWLTQQWWQSRHDCTRRAREIRRCRRNRHSLIDSYLLLVDGRQLCHSARAPAHHCRRQPLAPRPRPERLRRRTGDDRSLQPTALLLHLVLQPGIGRNVARFPQSDFGGEMRRLLDACGERLGQFAARRPEKHQQRAYCGQLPDNFPVLRRTQFLNLLKARRSTKFKGR